MTADVRRLVAYLAILLMLVGCGLGELLSGGDSSQWVDMTPADLAGVWRSDRGDMIEFTADGDFFGDDVKYMFEGTDVGSEIDLSQDTATGSGQWHLTTALGDPHGEHAFVGLGFDVVANQPTAVSIEKLLGRRDDDGIYLTYHLGDPDLQNLVIYRRCDVGCPQVAPDRPPLGVATAVPGARLAGTWRDQYGARLALNTDGGYTAQDLRFAYVGAEVLLPPGLSPRKGPLSSAGTWSTKPPPHDPSKPATTVVLAIKTIEGKPSFGTRTLRIYVDGQDLVLATVSSNPDVVEQHIYHRVPDGPPTGD